MKQNTQKTVRDLSPNRKNPRKISNEELRLLSNSMQEFGDLSGIVYNVLTKRLVTGHQRTKNMSYDDIIHVTSKYDKPDKFGTVAEGYIETKSGHRFTYREVNWKEDKELIANSAANNIGGQNDYKVLAEVLNEINDMNSSIDLALTGFNDKEIEKILNDSRLDKYDEDSPDKFREYDNNKHDTTITCPECSYSWTIKTKLVKEAGKRGKK